MYKILYKKALNLNDIKMLSFLQDIMEVYDKHNINSHINWDQNDRHSKSTDIRKSTKTKEASIKKAHSTKDLADSQRSIQKESSVTLAKKLI